MPEPKNGVLKLIIYVLLGCVTVGSVTYGLGRGSADSLKTEIKDNTDDIRQLERDSAAVQADLETIKTQLMTQDEKLDRILEAL